MNSDDPKRTGGDQPVRERRRRLKRRGDDEEGPRGVASLDDNRYGQVEFDVKGNAVWHWRIEEPRRREDDPTVNELECLTSEHLALADPDEAPPEGFNPYNNSNKGKR